MIIRSVCNLRQEVGEERLRVIRKPSRMMLHCEGNERRERRQEGWLTSLERFICKGVNLVLDSLVYLEPMKRF